MAERREYSLGLDLGTSGLKAVLLDNRGQVAASAQSNYPIRAERRSWAETDTADWERAAHSAVASLLEQVDDGVVVGVGIDGQMHGAVLIDASGHAVRPAILWPDTRADSQLDAWRRLDEESRARLANPLFPGMLGPIVAWVAQNEPEAWARTARVLSPKDWLRSRLIDASFVTDPSDASATLLWDISADDWCRSSLDDLGIADAPLPEVVPSEAVAGTLSAEHAASWGLPAGIPVAVGCADVAATLIGVGAPADRYTVIVGTGAQVLLPGARPQVNAAPRHHSYRCADESYYAMAALLNAGLALGWVREAFHASWDELYAPLKQSDDNYAGLPLFLPYLVGERMPEVLPDSSASWQGAGLHTSREHMLWSALEGVAMSIRRGIDSLPTPLHDSLDVVGGGGRQHTFLQLLANVTGRAVRRIAIEHPTAVGAAQLGWLVATGERSPVLRPIEREFHPEDSMSHAGRYETFVRSTSALASSPSSGR